MPWYAITLMTSGAALLLIARVVTWLMLARRNRRPGYVDLRRRRA